MPSTNFRSATGSVTGQNAQLNNQGPSNTPSSGTITVDPRQTLRDQFIDRLISTPAIGSTVVSQFIPTSNATTKGVDVSFQITNATGISTITLVRSSVQDVAQSVVLQSWTAAVATFTWSDTDKALQALGQAFYWLNLSSANPNGKNSVVGPEFILLNPSLLPPVPALAISASHAVAVNGAVLVTVNATGIAAGNSIKIYVTGYEGNSLPVAIAQHGSAPLQFTMQATGETVTLKAIAVSAGGAEAATGPTTTLVLSSSATVPAKPENVTVVQLSTGNQINWPANLETGVTAYQVYRGQRGDPFTSATLLATVSASGEGSVEYLDTGGLAGDFQYFIIAVAAVGNSLPSDAATVPVLFSSAGVPTNVPSNSTNNATLDSIDPGGGATIRIYGPGGVGTSYTRTMGFGNLTRVSGSITGLGYSTTYFVLFTAGTYLATTTYNSTLPDGYEWVGYITTCASGGTGGSSATCTVAVYSNQVVGVSPNAQGYGYTSATVLFGGPGSGAAAYAIVQNGRCVGYNVTAPGTGYTSAPTGTVEGGSSGTGGGGSIGNGGNRSGYGG